jgi:predicted DsbA family dithiol-disulfide isomerase
MKVKEQLLEQAETVFSVADRLRHPRPFLCSACRARAPQPLFAAGQSSVHEKRLHNRARSLRLRAMEKLRIDVWSDIACPWCYVGKHRLETALARFPSRAAVEVVWHSFELNPSAPAIRDPRESYSSLVARKFGASVAQAEARLHQMTEVAAADGITFRFDRVRAGSTFEAHQLLHFAKEHGLQNALKERIFRAYFSEGEVIGDRATLVRLALDVGLDEKEAHSALATGAYVSAVREDEDQARKLGITGVPFFVVAQRYALSGAQSPEVMLKTLEQAGTELGLSKETFAEGAACGPEGCA